MSRRHAAALALLGWYLLVPPPARDGGAAVPISKWVILTRDFAYPYPHGDVFAMQFRDLEECREALGRVKNRKIFEDKSRSDRAICIRDDDPRFKGNIRYTGK